jgi:CHAD domain-containing protein
VLDGPSRAYRLGEEEAPSEGLERIARGRIDHALDELRDDGSDTVAESVHEARKDLKKLRAVLRLVRGELDEAIYRRENERFRNAGRLLAGARDAGVKLKTLDALTAEGSHVPPKAVLRKYFEALQSERDGRVDVGEELDGAASEIEGGAVAVASLNLSTDSWDLVGPGLGRAYRRGRNRFRDARRDPSAEAIHEWRKRVKDLWYHLRILNPIWPELLGETADQAHALSELLGDHHDLAVLAEDARGRADRFNSGTDLAALLAAIERRQAVLFEDALALGARLYAEKPKSFVDRMERYWSAWRAA